MRTLVNANTIDSIREVWWDIRSHPGFGTIEIHAYDAVPSIGEIVNLAAFAQCLVVAIMFLKWVNRVWGVTISDFFIDDLAR
jgi:gamma-glutamyl:cysteine ligase YbdK (ATP-grasp superfamily)